MTKRVWMLALLLSVAAMPVLAAEKEAVDVAAVAKAGEPDPEAFPVLKKIKGEIKGLTYDYLGRDSGVDAWLLSGADLMQMVYVPTNGKGAIIGGTLVNEQGDAVSEKLQNDFTHQYPKRSAEILNTVRAPGLKKTTDTEEAATPSAVLWKRFLASSPIVLGPQESVPVIVAVLDPAKPETKSIWNALFPLALDNKIQLRVMPLALTSPNTIMQIASIIGSNDPVKSWANMIEGKATAQEGAMNDNTAETMKSIIDLATVLKLRELPFFAYRGILTDGGQGEVKVMRGQPADWGVFLQSLTSSVPAEAPKVEESGKKD